MFLARGGVVLYHRHVTASLSTRFFATPRDAGAKRRQTKQRDAILRVLQAASGPLAVQEIHTQAQRELGKIGIATVYRTLKLLQDDQHVAPVTMPTGEVRYEMAGLGHHVHFQCRSCRQVVDLPPSTKAFLRGMRVPAQFVVEACEVTLYGLCAQCT